MRSSDTHDRRPGPVRDRSENVPKTTDRHRSARIGPVTVRFRAAGRSNPFRYTHAFAGVVVAMIVTITKSVVGTPRSAYGTIDGRARGRLTDGKINKKVITQNVPPGPNAARLGPVPVDVAPPNAKRKNYHGKSFETLKREKQNREAGREPRGTRTLNCRRLS